MCIRDSDIIGEQENLSIQGQDSVYLLHTREYTQTRNLLDFIKLEEAVSQNNISMAPVNTSREVFLPFRNDVVSIDSALFSGGYFRINIRNQSSLTVNFTLTIPGVTLGADTLKINASLFPGSSREIRQELTGYKYSEPAGQPPLFKNSLWVIAESHASGTNTGGNVIFDVEISDFYFSSVSGRFSEQSVGRKTDVIDAHLGENLNDFRNKITLKSASLSITAMYQSVYNNPFNLRIDSLTVLAKHNNEELYVTDKSGNRYFYFTVTGGNVNVEFNETNSNIADVINFVPDVFEISASYNIIGNNQSGTITSRDLSGISIDINAKSVLALARSSVKDTLALIIKPDDRIDIRNAQYGIVTMEALNAIPLKSWIKMDFVDSHYNHLFTLRIDNSDTIIVDGAGVDNITGEVISPTPSVKKVELSKQDILNLADAHYIIATVCIETSAYKNPDPVLVTVRASDWLRFNLYGHINYHINFDEL